MPYAMELTYRVGGYGATQDSQRAMTSDATEVTSVSTTALADTVFEIPTE